MRRWQTTADCSDMAGGAGHRQTQRAYSFSRLSGGFVKLIFSTTRDAAGPYNGLVCSAVGLYISLNQCS